MRRQRETPPLPVMLFPGTERLKQDFELQALSSADDLSDFLIQARSQLEKSILTPNGPPLTGRQIVSAYTDLTDRLMRRLFALACSNAGVDPLSSPIALIATGGYGRRELCPHSDIDITFVPHRDGDPKIDLVIRDMFSMLMDVVLARSGLEMGYAYRLMEDCGTLDHQTACGLLDARLVAGSERIFIQFEGAYWTGFNATDFIFNKIDERNRNLAKWGEQPGQVEPQLKEGPGGLRDIQTMCWLIQAKEHLSAARLRGERAWQVVTREMDFHPKFAQDLEASKCRILQIRSIVHALTHTEQDQIVVTRQEEVASLMGYSADLALPPPVERMMADLYGHLMLCRRTAAEVMEYVENSRLILGIGLDCRRKKIVPANDALESDDPGWLLWACELAQRYNLKLSRDIQHHARALVISSPYPADIPGASQCFTRILSSTGKVYPILQQMADLGVLEWFIPEFAGLMRLIPYDPAHEFTVGQHTLNVIKFVEKMLSWTADDGEEALEMRRTLLDLPHPERLMLAIVLHDCGKSNADLPHAETGEQMAYEVCGRLNWSDEATSDVAFLVRNHLLMAETSRLRDLSLDTTIMEFTKLVASENRLNMLYLLTYADTRAVGEGVWTAVKGRFLRELWLRSLDMLYSPEDIEEEDKGKLLARARQRLQKDQLLQNILPDLVTDHIQSMPASYLLNQPPDRIALHIGFIERVRAGEIVVDFLDEPRTNFTELTVCAPDAPGLLARITYALYKTGVVVHGAQVATRISATDRIALDRLWVNCRSKQLQAGKQKEVRKLLTSVLSVEDEGHLPSKKPPAGIELISVRNDISEHHIVIETSAPDEQGALYWPALALAKLGWDVESARVSTWLGAAHAVFYVRGISHLSESSIRKWVEDALHAEPPSDEA